MSVESPAFEVVKRSGALELRRYAPYVTASVRVDSSGYSAATYDGFGLLGDYIFGNNHASGSIAMTAPVTAGRASGTKIAMTAPVTSERERSEHLGESLPVCTVRCPGAYDVSFTMPSSYQSVEELPQPNDPRVKLEAVPSRLVAVKRFSGRLDDTDVAEATGELASWVAEQGLVATGEPVAAQYDAPWMPGFIRHNEVLIDVAERG